jgi:hypothetical protein
MNRLGQAIVLSMAIAFSATATAGDTPTSLDEIPAHHHANGAKDWAQTHLSSEPDLREQIEATKAFLDENAAGINSEVSRLKTAGILDRRSTSNIRNALDHARHSMTDVAESIDAEEQINGWNARMFSYELGMAADALAEQADPIAATLNEDAKGEGEEQDSPLSVREQQMHLAKTLKESSKLLKETAQAIVRHLK